jgi:hypothetical protein
MLSNVRTEERKKLKAFWREVDALALKIEHRDTK